MYITSLELWLIIACPRTPSLFLDSVTLYSSQGRANDQANGCTRAGWQFFSWVAQDQPCHGFSVCYLPTTMCLLVSLFASLYTDRAVLCSLGWPRAYASVSQVLVTGMSHHAWLLWSLFLDSLILIAAGSGLLVYFLNTSGQIIYKEQGLFNL